MVGNLTGRTFGFLTVEAVDRPGNDLHYRCRCACGRITVVLASNLRSGNTRSCGASSCRAGLIELRNPIEPAVLPRRIWT
jgi:hypothetical protein